jgi:hypothetical protein
MMTMLTREIGQRPRLQTPKLMGPAQARGIADTLLAR